MAVSKLTLAPAVKAALDAGFAAAFGGGPEGYFSAPGRTEIGGNHTDHQRGRVLAGAVNLDTAAAVTPSSAASSSCVIFCFHRKSKMILPKDDEDAEEEDIPCLQFLQCIVRDNELTIHCIFRSNDIFGAFYSNMFFIAYLGLKMKEEVNKEIVGEKLNFGGVHYHSTSGHIYNTDLKAARKLIKANK